MLDYLVTEALIAKYGHEQKTQQEKEEYERKRQEFKDDKGIEQRIAEAAATR